MDGARMPQEKEQDPLSALSGDRRSRATTSNNLGIPLLTRQPEQAPGPEQAPERAPGPDQASGPEHQEPGPEHQEPGPEHQEPGPRASARQPEPELGLRVSAQAPEFPA